MNKKYPSKVSYGLLLFIFLAFFAPIFLELYNNGLGQLSVALVLFSTVLYGFILVIMLRTVYIIDNDLLKIKLGFFPYRSIDIKSIRRVFTTNSILASPAASFDRIEIEHGEFGRVIISPKDKLAFSRELVQLNPKIENKLEEA
jgi:hypothetical protein